MRKSLYLKDDDYRLSFLYGNFTTLTRFTELDLARVVEERLGPLYVSIHATDPVVRTRMLRNPKGATSLRWLRGCSTGSDRPRPDRPVPGCQRSAMSSLAHAPRSWSAIPGSPPSASSRSGCHSSTPSPSSWSPHEGAGAADLEIIQPLAAAGPGDDRASHVLRLRRAVPDGRAAHPPTADYEGYSQHENGIGMVRAFYDELERDRDTGAATSPGRDGGVADDTRRPGHSATGRPDTSSRPGVPATGGPVVVLTGPVRGGALDPVLPRSRRCRASLRLLRVPTILHRQRRRRRSDRGEDVRAGDRRRRFEPASVYLLPDVALQGDRVPRPDVPSPTSPCRSRPRSGRCPPPSPACSTGWRRDHAPRGGGDRPPQRWQVDPGQPHPPPASGGRRRAVRGDRDTRGSSGPNGTDGRSCWWTPGGGS